MTRPRTTAPSERLTLTRPEAAKALGVAGARIDELLESGALEELPRAKSNGHRRITRASVEALAGISQQPSRPRLPSEMGVLAVNPAVQAVDFRSVAPDREYICRSFGLPDFTPLEVHNLNLRAPVAKDGIRPPVDGALYAVTVAGSEGPPWCINGAELKGPAILAGRLPDAPAPNPRARDLGLMRLYDVDAMRDMIDLQSTGEEPAAPDAKAGAETESAGGEQ